MEQTSKLSPAIETAWSDFREEGILALVVIKRDAQPLTPESRLRVAFEQSINLG